MAIRFLNPSKNGCTDPLLMRRSLTLLVCATSRRPSPDSAGTSLPSWVQDGRLPLRCLSKSHEEAVESCIEDKSRLRNGIGGIEVLFEPGKPNLLLLRGWLVVPSRHKEELWQTGLLHSVCTDRETWPVLEQSQVLCFPEGSCLAFVLQLEADGATSSEQNAYAIYSCFRALISTIYWDIRDPRDGPIETLRVV